MRAIAIFTILSLMTVAFAVPTLDAGKPTSCRPGNVFQNDDVRVWFHGSKGLVKVFDTNGSSDEGAHFDYSTGEIEEISSSGAALAYMNLERAFPQSSGCTITETDEFVNMTLSVTDDVHAAHGPTVGTATVDFAYHFNKTSHEAKFDLNVTSWPWQGDGLLAYAFDVHASEGNLTEANNGVGWTDANGTARGSVTWAPNANATYADGHQEESNVTSSTTIDGQTAHVALQFTNVTAGYTHLAYDPTASAGAWVIVAGQLVSLAPVEDLLPSGTTGLLRSLL